MDRDTAKRILLDSLPTYLERKGINVNKKFQCLCPNHPDNNPSMVYSRQYNNVHCFACGANGDIFDVICWDYGVSTFKEAFDIGCNLFGLEIGSEKKDLPKIMPKKKNQSVATEKKKAPVDVCDRVYRQMKEWMPLTPEDRKYLKETRGLSDARIDADYFRMDQAKQKSVIRKLKLLLGYNSKDILKTVPGFYLDKKGELTYYHESGIAILLRDAEGKAHAVQIRRDTSEKGRRYTWFSSSFAKEGTSPGAAKDVLIPEKPRQILYITEGRFKAEVLAEKRNITISVQGVSTWKGIDKIIAQIRESHELKAIYLMFDSDVMSNPQLIKTLQEMTKRLNGSFPDLQIKVCVWRMEDGKGIDDCYFNGNAQNVQYVDVQVFYKQCLQTVDDLMREYNVKNLHALAPDEIKRFKKDLQTRNEDLFLPPVLKRRQAEKGTSKEGQKG